jgi:hypothetical protein
MVRYKAVRGVAATWSETLRKDPAASEPSRSISRIDSITPHSAQGKADGALGSSGIAVRVLCVTPDPGIVLTAGAAPTIAVGIQPLIATMPTMLNTMTAMAAITISG